LICPYKGFKPSSVGSNRILLTPLVCHFVQLKRALPQLHLLLRSVAATATDNTKKSFLEIDSVSRFGNNFHHCSLLSICSRFVNPAISPNIYAILFFEHFICVELNYTVSPGDIPHLLPTLISEWELLLKLSDWDNHRFVCFSFF